MKTLIQFLRCVNFGIKKNFFSVKKSDNSHDCVGVSGFNIKMNSEEDNNDIEEYLKNYSTTTRWQTV